MPSLPTNAFWGNPFGRYLNNQKKKKNIRDGSLTYLVISMVTLYAFPVIVNTLFQWIIHKEYKYGWSVYIKALIQTAVFSPFSIAFLLFTLESGRKYAFFTILEVGITWVGSFTWAATYRTSWNESYSTFILSSRLAFTFVPHIWLVLLVVTLLHFLKFARQERFDRISVGDLGDSSYYMRLEVGRVHWSKKEEDQSAGECSHGKYPIELPHLHSNGDLESFEIESPSIGDEKGEFELNTTLDNELTGHKIPKAGQSVFAKESKTRSIRWTLALNIFLYLVFFSFFAVIKELSGTEIWSFSTEEIRKNIYRIYLSLLIICVIGKFCAKRIARFVDRSGSDEYASAEILMECMFDVFYSVMFRFLFPVLSSVGTFVVIKLLHCAGDLMQNLIRISETYYVWTSWVQETWLFKWLGFVADNSTREEWNTRVEVDTTIRFFISVLVGLQIITLNMCIFPAMFGWTLLPDAEWFNISSILIELIVYFGSIRLLPSQQQRFLNPIKVLRMLNETSYEYVVFLVLCLQYVECYIGVPKEVKKH